jgi:hypothetical protein
MIPLVEHQKAALGKHHLPCHRGIVFFPITDYNKYGKRAIGLKKRVDFYSAFSFSKTCPWKDGETEFNECGVQDIKLPGKLQLILWSQGSDSR